MDTIIQRYSLNKDTFLGFLQRETILLSGSSALACYLKQEGVEAGFEPNDLDLWVSSSDLEGQEKMIDFLRESGYRITRCHVENDQYIERLNGIQQVVTLEDPTGSNKIQVIRVSSPKSLINYVVNHFDFSACMTWWNGEIRQFETIYSALTLQKKMFVRRTFISQIHSGKMEERLQKYIGRGFTVIDEPPPFWTEPDPRMEEALEPWKGVKGFDVFEYDDVGILEHLKASEWNIVLGVGGRGGVGGVGGVWYVFERKRISECMKEKRHIDPMWGMLYDTPFRQTISHEAWDGLFYSDHSIFVLVSPEDHLFRGSTKTVYDVEAYSTLDWAQSVVSRVYDKRSQLRLIAVADQEDIKEEDQEDIIQVIGSSLHLHAEDFMSDNEDDLGLHLLIAPHEDLVAPVAPIPDIPFSPILRVMSESESELYHQLMEWIQVDPSYM